MRQFVCLLGLFLALAIQVEAQSADDSTKLTLFPKGRWFKPLYLDPLEAQVFGSFSGVSQNRSVLNPERSFLPFGIGAYKAFLRNEGKHRWEWGMEFLVITQFEFDKNDIGTGRTMLGVDYKAASNLTYLIRDDLAVRFRLYHLSAHWGDDFIILNGINTFDSAKLYNYNQFDITLQWEKEKLRYYIGAGIIPFQDVDFDGITMQAGVYYTIRKSTFLRYIAGIDVKAAEYFDFRPQVKTGIGIELGREKEAKSIRFLIEYFNGHQPYLSYEDPNPRQWIGLGTSFNW